MKTNALFSSVAVLAVSLLPASAGPEDDVKGAAAKLAAQSSYSWKTTAEGAGRFGTSTTEGTTEKDGLAHVVTTRGENTTEVVLKGGKGASKTDNGWAAVTEPEDNGDGGQRFRGRFLIRMVQTFQAPAAQAQDILGKVKSIQQEGEAYSGALTEDGVKSLLAFGGRRGGGGEGPPVSNAKGSAKFWIKDGVLAKYQYNVEGTVEFNGEDRDIDRTTTVEIKNVGTAKVSVPDEARKALL